MAEGNGEDEEQYSFRNFTHKKERKTSEGSDEADDSFVKPDLGIGNEPSFEKNGENYVSGEQHANPASEHPKREENPFSFKHFLKRDAGSSYHSTGARPKVFNDHQNESFSHIETVSVDSDPGLCQPRNTRHVGTPEFSSVLPDFVQDHLVVEQCYLSHSDACSPQLGVNLENLENLPDFAINSSPDKNRSRLWNDSRSPGLEVNNDSIFDSSDRNNRESLMPLDLPSDLGLPSFLQSPTKNKRLPFDLPLVADNVDEGSNSVPSALRGSQGSEVGVSKSLPDFLSDGPIHSSRLSDISQPSPDSPGSNASISPQGSQPVDQQRPFTESERLRRELEATRRQFADKTRRVHALEKELLSIRCKDQEEMATLEKAIEQVEDNLKRSTRRAVTAENNVSKLKQEMKVLSKELSELRQENSALRYCQGAASATSMIPEGQQTQRLAQDLRAAAHNAEQSLRTLLAGVGNLKVMASTLENLHRITDQTGDYLEDPDDESGAAL